MEQLLEPLKFYENGGRQLHADNVKTYFDGLLAKSKVDVAQNKASVKLYDSEMKKLEAIEKRLTRFKVLRVFAIIFAVLLAITSIFLFIAALVVFGALSVAGAITLVVLVFALINKKIKQIRTNRDAQSQKAERQREVCLAQVAPLNALFTSRDTFDLIEKTVPDIKFDKYFSRKSERKFVANYGFAPRGSEDSSATHAVSGEIMENPFVFCRKLRRKMGVETYHGSLVISWTETERDSDGRIQTVRRTETLHATVTKPKPYYLSDTALYFGSHAAPDLSFSRRGKHTEDLSEKQVEKKVRSGKKRLEKKAAKALRKGGSFQEMSNAEFDVLFGADDRDNETQFRMMYTPLAQINTVDLLRSETGYGDDFNFVKSKRINMIRSEHMQSWRMSTSPVNYYSHSVDIIRENFESFNNEYFKSVFFDLAPLLAVPIYNEKAPSFLDESGRSESHFSTYEHEVMANKIGYERFVADDSETQAILKTELLSTDAGGDVVGVTAYSYTTVGRLDLVPVFGGDGRMHPVPVNWVEYIPVECKSKMRVELDPDGNTDESDENGIFNGLLASLINN